MQPQACWVLLESSSVPLLRWVLPGCNDTSGTVRTGPQSARRSDEAKAILDYYGQVH